MKQLYYKVGLILGIFKSKDFVKASWVVAKAIEFFNDDSYRGIVSNDDSPVYAYASLGLCRSLVRAFRYHGMNRVFYGEDVHKILYKFNPGFLKAKYTHTNLMENPFYIDSPCWGQYWWDEGEYYLRLNALNKLYRYYLAHDILIKKSDHSTV